jgi:hypothetical protein
MAGDRRPTFSKRQKEQKRLAKAAAKREARLARSQAKLNPPEEIIPPDEIQAVEPSPPVEAE